MIKTETAILVALLAWAAAMPTGRSEGYNGPEPMEDGYRPEPVEDGYGENRPPKNLITKPLSELHEFTSKDGKRISGKIRAYDPAREIITIVKEDRNAFKVELKIFSEADQAYVREWHLIQEFFKKLRCQISTTQEWSKGETEFMIWKPGERSKKIVFDITLKNRSGCDLNDLTADYCIYYELDRAGNLGGVEEGIKYGTLNIGMLAGGEKVNVKTQPLVLPKGVLEDYMFNRKNPIVNVRGIWIRIYLPLPDGRKAMREFFTPDDLRNHYKWAPKKIPKNREPVR